jgi:hypothetical protein
MVYLPYLKQLFILCLFFLLIERASSQQAYRQNNLVPIDTIVKSLEHKRNISLYYQPEWFDNKTFHSSILELPIDEISNILKNACNCSAIAVDSFSIVFIPNEKSLSDITVKNNDVYTTIGSLRDFGKFKQGTLTGKIVNGKTGEPLIGVRIYVYKTKTGAVTDKNGKFKLTLAVGEYDLKLSYTGFEDNLNRIKLCGDGSATFEIMEKSILLNEVIITTKRAENNLVRTQVGMVQLTKKDIKELPMTLGVTDIIKSVTLLPGVQSIGEFGTGFNVRGGSNDQNLILVENVPIFNSSHLFGLTSIVNPDGITEVTLLKAGIPAKYGERASSLMDIRMGTANSEKIKGVGGIGLMDSRLTLDVPLLKNKVNLLVGGRTFYSDWIINRIPDIDLMNSSAKFYDLNAFLTVSPDENNKFVVFGYYSNDKFSYGVNLHYLYSNSLASIRWNHVLNHKLSSNLMAGLSNYNNEVGQHDNLKQIEAYKIYSKVFYKSLKWNLNWHPNNNHSVDFGANAIFYDINPGNLAPYDTFSHVIPVEVSQEKGNEYAVYASDNFSITQKLGVEFGLRYSYYALIGPGTEFIYKEAGPITKENIVDTIFYSKGSKIKKYSGLEPRLSLRYSINDVSSVKLSYSRMNQYINLISNTSVMAPTDIWHLSDLYAKPLKCDQYTLGYFHNFKSGAIETSLELYYKTLTNLIEYKNGAQLLLNDHLETDLINAKGKDYGIEAYLKKNTGKLTGWISYTYSRALEKTTGEDASSQINNNNYFPSNYDKPHNLVINLNYHISRRWRFSGSFLYSTGRPVTLPEVQYDYEGYQILYYSDRNKYRLPDYNRLDIAITWDESLRKKKIWKGSWTLSVINLYGRKNAYSVFYERDVPSAENNYREYSLYKLYIIGRPLPTLTYNFSF